MNSSNTNPLVTIITIVSTTFSTPVNVRYCPVVNLKTINKKVNKHYTPPKNIV